MSANPAQISQSPAERHLCANVRMTTPPISDAAARNNEMTPTQNTEPPTPQSPVSVFPSHHPGSPARKTPVAVHKTATTSAAAPSMTITTRLTRPSVRIALPRDCGCSRAMTSLSIGRRHVGISCPADNRGRRPAAVDEAGRRMSGRQDRRAGGFAAGRTSGGRPDHNRTTTNALLDPRCRADRAATPAAHRATAPRTQTADRQPPRPSPLRVR